MTEWFSTFAALLIFKTQLITQFIHSARADGKPIRFRLLKGEPIKVN